MRRAILLLLLLSLALSLVLTAVVVHLRSRVATLPDGTRIEFLGTAVGRAEFTTEKSWHKLARKVLPPSLARRIPPASRGSCSSGSNSVTFYFRVTAPNGAAIASAPWSGYSTEDETGFRYNAEGSSCSFGGGGSTIYGLIVRGYPRRQSSLALHFQDAQGASMATLQLPNPVRGPFPEWQPQALPQTQTNGPVTLTLLSLRAGGNAQWHSVRPKWTITASEPAWNRAKVRSATFSDATGNEGQDLSRRESAWQARALVFRERPEDFAAAERLVVTNLSIPVVGGFVPVDQSLERNGVKLTALVLAGPGHFCITNGVHRGMAPGLSNSRSTSSQGTNTVESWGSSLPFMLVEAKNLQPDDEILLRLLDDQGREIKLGDTGGYDVTANGGRLYKRTFTALDDAKSLTLELLVNRPLIFEFMVNPAEVQPAPAPPTQQ